MQLYIAIDGEKQGPISLYNVIEMLEEGRVDPEALGWHQGREKWSRLDEIPALKGTIKTIRTGAADREPTSAGEPAKAAATEVAPEAPRSEPAELPAASDGESPAATAAETPADPAASEIPRRKAVRSQEVRPFARFWARIFDYMLVYTVIWMIAGLPIPKDTSTWDWMRNPEQFFEQSEIVRLTTVTFGAFAIWHAIEAILLHTIGTTPGKALFSIRVRRFDGGRARLAKTLGRSYFVWVAGFGLGIFPFNLIAMAFSFFRLLSTGTTLWDKHLRLYIQHAPIGPARILLAVAAFALLMALQKFVFI